MTPAPRLTRRTTGAIAVVAALLGVAVALVVFRPADPGPRRVTPAAPSPTPTPTPSQSSTPPQPSLLSGRLGKPDQPVIAVKIDNTAKSHPQVGVSKADVVYVEQVEGGVTRLAAVYSSVYPTYVGPVRSARITDIELLKQYGRVGLVYSGSQNRLHDNLSRAGLGLVSFDRDRIGYRRAANRPAPYDVIGTFAQLVRRAGKVDVPAEVGYTFGDAPLGGKPATSFSARYPFATVSAEWNAPGKRWLVAMDGVPARAAEGGRLGPTTFIVQFTTITGSGYYDVNGVETPMTKTLGRGKALFFRDGQVFEGAWERRVGAQPTRYTIGGEPAVLAPGQIWVALIGRDRPVIVR